MGRRAQSIALLNLADHTLPTHASLSEMMSVIDASSQRALSMKCASRSLVTPPTVCLASRRQRPSQPGGRSALVGQSWRKFFFFQAEDGIRDLTVTGVQTCALPI